MAPAARSSAARHGVRRSHQGCHHVLRRRFRGPGVGRPVFVVLAILAWPAYGVVQVDDTAKAIEIFFSLGCNVNERPRRETRQKKVPKRVARILQNHTRRVHVGVTSSSGEGSGAEASRVLLVICGQMAGKPDEPPGVLFIFGLTFCSF